MSYIPKKWIDQVILQSQTHVIADLDTSKLDIPFDYKAVLSSSLPNFDEKCDSFDAVYSGLSFAVYGLVKLKANYVEKGKIYHFEPGIVEGFNETADRDICGLAISEDELLLVGQYVIGEGSSGGDRGVFGEGAPTTDGISNVRDYITISIPGDATDFGDATIQRREIAAASNGSKDRGVFAGGSTNASGPSGYDVNIIDYVTISSPADAIDFGDLTLAREELEGQDCSNKENDRGIFAGGWAGNIVSVIDYVTISTLSNASNFGNLSFTRMAVSSTSNGTNDRGVFGGGDNNSGTFYNIIDYITISSPSNAQDFGDLTAVRSHLAATSNGTNDRGVFGGGWDGSNNFNTVDYITISTSGNAQDFGDLTTVRGSLSATSNGINDRGVFGGGGDGSNFLNSIDYVTISTSSNAQDFGDLTVARTHFSATSNA